MDGAGTVPGTHSAPRPQRLIAQEPNRDRANSLLWTSLSHQDTDFLIKVLHLERKYQVVKWR